MTDEELLKQRKHGFIPGPLETEDEFKARIDECLNLHSTFEEFPLEEGSSVIAEAFPLTEKLFGISPSWVLCLFSNHEMMPWHGGCAWIFKRSLETPTTSFLQLRKEWKKKSTLFGIYHRKELIAHELSHVGRMAFDEPIYEEFFAYLSSTSKLQKHLGPMIRSSYESMAFVVTLFTLLVLDGTALFSGYFDLYEKLQLLKIIPIGMVLFALSRLFYRRKIFTKACRVIGGSKFLYSLKDSEIDRISTFNKDMLQSWIEENASNELRFRQLLLWMRR